MFYNTILWMSRVSKESYGNYGVSKKCVFHKVSSFFFFSSPFPSSASMCFAVVELKYGDVYVRIRHNPRRIVNTSMKFSAYRIETRKIYEVNIRNVPSGTGWDARPSSFIDAYHIMTINVYLYPLFKREREGKETSPAVSWKCITRYIRILIEEAKLRKFAFLFSREWIFWRKTLRGNKANMTVIISI